MFPHTFWGQVNFPSSQAEDLGSVNPSQGLGNLCLVHLASPLHPWDGGEEQWLPQPSPQKDYKGLRGEMETINVQGLAACSWKGKDISPGMRDPEQSHAFWEHSISLHLCSSQQHLLAGSMVMALAVQGAGLPRKGILTSNGSLYFCIIGNRIND